MQALSGFFFAVLVVPKLARSRGRIVAKHLKASQLEEGPSLRITAPMPVMPRHWHCRFDSQPFLKLKSECHAKAESSRTFVSTCSQFGRVKTGCTDRYSNLVVRQANATGIERGQGAGELPFLKIGTASCEAKAKAGAKSGRGGQRTQHKMHKNQQV